MPRQPPPFRKTPATALIAEANAWAMDKGTVPATLDHLIQAVVADPRESYLLLKALRQWHDSDMPILIERLLEDRARWLKERETAEKDKDETFAQAMAALSAAVFVGVGVGVLAGTIIGPIGPLVVIVTPPAILAIAWKRWWIRTAQRAFTEDREATESLSRAVTASIKAFPHSG